jgi:hypothetical protein
MAGVGVGGAPSAQGLSVTAVLEVPGKPALDLGLALDVGSGHTLGSVIAVGHELPHPTPFPPRATSFRHLFGCRDMAQHSAAA